MNIVTLKDISFELKAPKSLASAYDVAGAAGKNPSRAMYASLGLCWNGKQKLRSKFSDSYDALQYGGEVFDELTRVGFSPSEIIDAATSAFSLMISLLPSADEVEAAEGNSEAQEASTTT